MSLRLFSYWQVYQQVPPSLLHDPAWPEWVLPCAHSTNVFSLFPFLFLLPVRRKSHRTFYLIPLRSWIQSFSSFCIRLFKARLHKILLSDWPSPGPSVCQQLFVSEQTAKQTEPRCLQLVGSFQTCLLIIRNIQLSNVKIAPVTKVYTG